MSIHKILIADKVDERAVQILKEAGFEVDEKTGLSEDELVKIIPGYNAVIVRSGAKVTKKIIEASDKLKVIGRAGVGVDNIDVEEATKRNILVMNTPQGNVLAAAELTIGLMLALARCIATACKSIKSCKWERNKFVGTVLYQKVLGLVGCGRVGKIVAKFAKVFDMEVLVFDPYVSDEAAKAERIKKVALEELLKNSDYISIHAPLNDETRGMIGEEQIKMMKRGARVINVGRGGIVDEKALYKAIKEEKLAGAAIDVWETEPPGENPLLELDNVVATPHIGASAVEAQEMVAVDIANQFVDFFTKGKIINAVNKIKAPISF